MKKKQRFWAGFYNDKVDITEQGAWYVKMPAIYVRKIDAKKYHGDVRLVEIKVISQ